MNDILEKLEREKLYPAGFLKRVLAYLIDMLVISFIVSAVFYDKMANLEDLSEVSVLLSNFFIGLLLLQFSYDFVFVALYGATLGKMACKIAVVDEASLAKPGILQSALRSAVKLLSDACFKLGFAWALGNDLRKSWQDYAAKTLVIELA